jgi:hypothetical protein
MIYDPSSDCWPTLFYVEPDSLAVPIRVGLRGRPRSIVNMRAYKARKQREYRARKGKGK